MEKSDIEAQETFDRPGPIQPDPENQVCPECGSAEIECLDWVRLNDNYFIGGNESMPADDYWCPNCEVHEKPVDARDYCEEKGHAGSPCSVCGT